ncbi:hypothetical protein PYCC9005_001996 [Savitreella phatthalungensis]
MTVPEIRVSCDDGGGGDTRDAAAFDAALADDLEREQERRGRTIPPELDDENEGRSASHTATEDFSWDIPEEEAKPCPHLKKSCRMGRISPKIRELKKRSLRVCKTCTKDRARGNTTSASGDNSDDGPQLWLCLCCGNLYCGRYDKAHAQAHHAKLDQDCVMWNIDTHAAWCYKCDNDVRPDVAKRRNEVLVTVNKYWEKHAGDLEKEEAVVANVVADETREVGMPEKLDFKAVSPGLVNLGNTCYFNSVMQVMACVDSLHDILAEPYNSTGQLTEISRPQAPQAPLTASFTKLLNEVYANTLERHTLRPGSLFGELHRQAPKFTKGAQQDAQELFHYLLDGLKEEEHRASKSGAVTTNSADDELPVIRRTRSRRTTISSMQDDRQSIHTIASISAETDQQAMPPPKMVPADTPDRGPWRPHGYVEEIFEGRLASVVVCSVCKSVSTTYDQFGELSLSLVRDNAGKSGASEDEGKRTGRYSFRSAVNEFGRRAREGVSLTRSSSRLGRSMSRKSPRLAGLNETPSRNAPASAAATPATQATDTGMDSDVSNGLLSPRERSRVRTGPVPISLSEAVSEEEDNVTAEKQLKRSNFSLSEAKKRLERLSFAFAGGSAGARSVLGQSAASAPLESLQGIQQSQLESLSVADRDRLAYIERMLQEIEPTDAMKGSIEDSLRDFVRVEVLEGANAFACEECAKILAKYRQERLTLRANAAVAAAAAEAAQAAATASANGKRGSIAAMSNVSDPMSDAASNGPLSPALSAVRPTLSQRSSYMDLDKGSEATAIGTDDDGAAGSTAGGASGGEDKPAPKYILRKAYKRFLVADLPKVLVLHLKRFQQSGKSMYSSLKKVDTHVRFERELDMAPYLMPADIRTDGITLTDDSGHPREIMYRCIGCIVHIGSIHSGHYVAYFFSHKVLPARGSTTSQETDLLPGGKGSQTRRWLFASDTTVRPATWEEVSKCRAYLVFYERI